VKKDGRCIEGPGWARQAGRGLGRRDRYTRLTICPSSTILTNNYISNSQVKNSVLYFAVFVFFLTTLLTTQVQANAEPTYSANCRALGDGITLTSTGETVLEQRLVKFEPIETYKSMIGQRGMCTIKKDPPGYRWIRCDKRDGSYSEVNNNRISPIEFAADSVQHMASRRHWSGACKVKL
jgi:hypothetical protein